jgi:hypothetical protein
LLILIQVLLSYSSFLDGDLSLTEGVTSLEDAAEAINLICDRRTYSEIATAAQLAMAYVEQNDGISVEH